MSDDPAAGKRVPRAPRRNAGLHLSVGSASRAVRVVVSTVFLTTGALCVASGLTIGAGGPAAATLVAIVLVIPLGIIACIAAAFVLAPFSRFGVWLDELLPSLNGWRGVMVAALLAAVAATTVMIFRIA